MSRNGASMEPRLRSCVTFAFVLRAIVLGLFPDELSAKAYFVAVDGKDGNDGGVQTPFATLGRGQQAASAGDTVYIRGGVYRFSGNSAVGVKLDKSGSPGARIHYFAHPGEKPVFDFFDLTPRARITGIQVRADWIHIKGLELRGVQQILTDANESWGIHIQGSHNVFERLDLHDNEGPGLFIKGGGDNLVLNCDSYYNYDPDRGGENADGFGCHSTGSGNLFRGCRAWYNSDDGYDFINSPGVCTVEYSWAFRNGFVPGTSRKAGNGAGFKAGGFGLDSRNFPDNPPRHVIRFNVAWGNRAQGFYSNHHPGGIDWIHNTAYDNFRNFDMLDDVGHADHYLRNNLGLGGGIEREEAERIDQAHNSWNLPVSLNESDFLSVDDAGTDGPRRADGGLPDLPFLRLDPNSHLVDAGEVLGFPFVGTAPDLGAFEAVDTSPVRRVERQLHLLRARPLRSDAAMRFDANGRRITLRPWRPGRGFWPLRLPIAE